MIEVCNVKKSYQQSNAGKIFFKKKKKVLAIEDVCLDIKAKEKVAFVGLNGSGKSTLIKLITGIIKADYGYIKVFGNDSFKKRKENSKYYGILFGQKSNLIWDLPAKKSFELLRDIYSVDREEYNKLIDYLDSYLKIRDLMEIPVRELSFGQRMRLEISSILIHSPKLVILDEAFIGLDFVTKEDISTLFDDYVNRFSSSLIMTSHDISDIYLMCQRYIVFDSGKVILDEKKSDFSNKYNYKQISIVLKDSVLSEKLDEDYFKMKFVKMSKKVLKDDIYEAELIIEQKYTDQIISLINEKEIYEFQVSNINLEEFIRLYKEGLI